MTRSTIPTLPLVLLQGRKYLTSKIILSTVHYIVLYVYSLFKTTEADTTGTGYGSLSSLVTLKLIYLYTMRMDLAVGWFQYKKSRTYNVIPHQHSKDPYDQNILFGL